jgi:hypothetical protein
LQRTDGMVSIMAGDSRPGEFHTSVRVGYGQGNDYDAVSATTPLPVTTQASPADSIFFRRSGYNTNVTGVGYTMLDTVGAAQPWMPQVASTITIVSTSAADSVSGAGARKLFIEGVDAGFNYQYEIIDLNGTTPVVSALSFIRLLSANVVEAGAYGGTNLGTISISATTSGTLILKILFQVGIGDGQTKSSHIIIPAGARCGLTGFTFNVDTTKVVDVVIFSRTRADLTTSEFHATQVEQVYIGIDGGRNALYDPPVPFPALTDVWAVGKQIGGGSPAAVSVEFWGWQIGGFTPFIV